LRMSPPKACHDLVRSQAAQAMILSCRMTANRKLRFSVAGVHSLRGDNVLLALLQFENPPIFEGERQFMTKSLSPPDNGFIHLFAFLVGLVQMLCRPPVGDVTVVAFPKKPFNMPLQARSPTCPLCKGVTGRPLIFCCFRTSTLRKWECEEGIRESWRTQRCTSACSDGGRGLPHVQPPAEQPE